VKLPDVRLLLPSRRDQRRVAAVLEALADHSQGLTAHELQLITRQSTGKLAITLARLSTHGQISAREIHNWNAAMPSKWLYALPRRPQ